MKPEPSDQHVEIEKPGGWLTWNKLLILTVTVMTLTFLLVVAAVRILKKNDPQPQVVHPGEVIDTLGEYRSRNGRLRVLVGPSDPPGSIQWKTSGSDSSTRLDFDASADWFATIDQDDRAWLYTSTEGVIVFDELPPASSTTQVGAGGGWEGIPATFLEKLPDKHRADYETWVKKKGVLRPAEQDL